MGVSEKRLKVHYILMAALLDCIITAGHGQRLTVGGQQELRGILLWQPADLVDLLLDLQALQVVELGLVALEGAVDVVLAAVLGYVLVLKGPREH